MKKITGKKIEMSQVFDKEGNIIPITLIESEDCGKLKQGQQVKVTAISKAKGFQGVVKRWGFKGFPASHGTKHHLRAPGAIGSAWPERVLKGKKMAGRMGGKKVTVRGLEVIEIDKKKHLLKIKGAVPGKRGTEVKVVAT